MAHIGKNWKLHFRRDLSLQVNRNAKGWGEKYVVVLHNAFGTVASPASGMSWTLPIQFDATTGQCTGESEHRTIAGREVFFRIIGDIIADPQRYKIRMQAFGPPSTKLYERILVDTVLATYGSFGADRDNGVLVQTPGVFEADPSSPALDGFFVKTWH